MKGLFSNAQSVYNVPDMIGFIWRQLLVAAAKAGVADDLMWRYIKDASDNSVGITDFGEDEDDASQTHKKTEPRQVGGGTTSSSSRYHNGLIRMSPFPYAGRGGAREGALGSALQQPCQVAGAADNT
jgi:hypothetical protein